MSFHTYHREIVHLRKTKQKLEMYWPLQMLSADAQSRSGAGGGGHEKKVAYVVELNNQWRKRMGLLVY